MEQHLQNGTFLAQLFSVVFMTAIIWFVQLVAYPQFLEVGETEFPSYHSSHGRRISMIVVPMMLLELASSILGAYLFRNHEWKFWMLIGAVLTILTWVTTFSIQVPQHGKLTEGFSRETIRSLVQGNWIRTVLWTVHSILLLSLWLRGAALKPG